MINANSSASAHIASPLTQLRPSAQEAGESKRGPDNDGDRDDHVAMQTSQSTPSVNASGQTIGQIINVSA